MPASEVVVQADPRGRRRTADAPPAADRAPRAGPPSPADLPALIRDARPQLVRLAYRFCWNWQDAEDAVQDALLLASQRLGQLDDAARLETWVKSIVVRQSIDRRRQRPPPAGSLDRAESHPAREHASDAADALPALLKSLIPRLAPRQQAALVLREISGMEYAEVAMILEIEESTVRVLVRNAREALRDLLSQARHD